jgi:hypothetical protein
VLLHQLVLHQAVIDTAVQRTLLVKQYEAGDAFYVIVDHLHCSARVVPHKAPLSDMQQEGISTGPYMTNPRNVLRKHFE